MTREQVIGVIRKCLANPGTRLTPPAVEAAVSLVGLLSDEAVGTLGDWEIGNLAITLEGVGFRFTWRAADWRKGVGHDKLLTVQTWQDNLVTVACGTPLSDDCVSILDMKWGGCRSYLFWLANKYIRAGR